MMSDQWKGKRKDVKGVLILKTYIFLLVKRGVSSLVRNKKRTVQGYNFNKIYILILRRQPFFSSSEIFLCWGVG